MKNIPKNRTVDITILYRNGGGEESNSFAVDNARKHEEGIMEWQRVAEEKRSRDNWELPTRDPKYSNQDIGRILGRDYVSIHASRHNTVKM